MTKKLNATPDEIVEAIRKELDLLQIAFAVKSTKTDQYQLNNKFGYSMLREALSTLPTIDEREVSSPRTDALVERIVDGVAIVIAKSLVHSYRTVDRADLTAAIRTALEGGEYGN